MTWCLIRWLRGPRNAALGISANAGQTEGGQIEHRLWVMPALDASS
jgi:hypothetical protein